MASGASSALFVNNNIDAIENYELFTSHTIFRIDDPKEGPLYLFIYLLAVANARTLLLLLDYKFTISLFCSIF